MATSADALRHLLRRKGPGLLFGMIQKQRGSDAAWKVWADSGGQKALIERFKKPLLHAEPAIRHAWPA